MSTYLVWKTLHIISGAILFGTGLGIAYFAWFAYRQALRTQQIEGLRSVLKLTVLADACFTAPAVIFQFISGMILMHLADWPFGGRWFITVITLFILVGVCWVPVVVIQVLLNREAQRVATMTELSSRFHRLFKIWFALGVPAFFLVIVLFILMVTKGSVF